MKTLLSGLALFFTVSSLADNSSCLNYESLTGLSDNAALEIRVDRFRQGYLEDLDSSLEIRLDTIVQGYDSVRDITNKLGERTISTGNISGVGDRISRITFPYKHNNNMELTPVNSSSIILLSELHKELFSVSNSKFADLIMTLDEVDKLTPNEEIGEITISIESLREGVMKFNGNVRFNFVFKKEGTKALASLRVLCN